MSATLVRTAKNPAGGLTIDQKRRLRDLERHRAILTPEEKEQLRQLNEADSLTFPKQLE